MADVMKLGKEREYLTFFVRHLKQRLSLIILNICPINCPVAVQACPADTSLGRPWAAVCARAGWDTSRGQNPSSPSPWFPGISNQVAELYHK